MTVSVSDFSWAFRNHAAGVAVVTADVGDGPVGLTATSVISVSADPAVLAFSVSDRTSCAPEIARALSVVVHLLSVEQLDIAKLCSSPNPDRFADTSIWRTMPTGEPYFPSASAWFRCTVTDRIRAGTATLTVVSAVQMGGAEYEPTTISGRIKTPPLVYHDRNWYGLDDSSAAGLGPLSEQPRPTASGIERNDQSGGVK